MVYGMARRHGAQIEIASEIGRGTTIHLVLPLSAAAGQDDRGADEAIQPLQRLRILVVDDDPLVLSAIQHSLEGDGHRVTLADGGQAGIEAFAAAQGRGEPFAVVITDLGMPYVDGRKVAAAIKTAAPGTPVILLTGWGHRLAAANETPQHVDRIVGKPPKLVQLRAVLAELTVSRTGD